MTAVGLAARVIPPSTLWWPQIAALLVPVSAPVTGVAGLLWTARAARVRTPTAWGLAALHLAVASATLWRASESPPRAGEGEGLTVLTLNAAYSRRGDASEIASRVAATAPHVVAFQEVSARPGPDAGTWHAQGGPLALLQDSTYTLTTLDRARPKNGLLTNGTALFVRLPASLSVPGQLDTLSAVASGKYTRTELAWEGRQIAVYNVHFRSFSAPRPWKRQASWWSAVRATRKDFLAREAEARTLRRQLDAETLPFLVLGDFNATPDQWSYTHVAQGLVDVLGTGLWRATYPDDRPLVRIDAVLASLDWTVRLADIQPPGVSDHRAVVAELVLAR